MARIRTWPNSLSSSLVEGTYTFKISVTDDAGAMVSDEVGLVVNPAANKEPTVSAGTDKKITLPTNTASFTAQAADADGTIVSYLWEKVDGPEADMVGVNKATLSLSNLIEGVYTFKVAVTDNNGAVVSDEVTLTRSPCAQSVADR